MKPIKKIIQETGRREFSDKWGVSLSVVDKWLAGTRNPNEFALILFNLGFEDKEQAIKTVEIQNGELS